MPNRQLNLFLALVLSLVMLLGVTDEATRAASFESVRPNPAGPTLTGNVQGQRYPISPDIYGMNANDINSTDFISQMQYLHLPVERWGGNTASRYNWQTNFCTAGLDWFVEGNPNTGNNPANGQPSETDEMINRDRANGAKTIIT